MEREGVIQKTRKERQRDETSEREGVCVCVCAGFDFTFGLDSWRHVRSEVLIP